MRFQITTLAGIILFFLCLTVTISAQDTIAIKSLPPVTVKAITKKIPDRIWKGFSGYFNDAENPGWYRVNKDYLAKFMIYDEQNRALFTKRGSLIYHISYGYEKSLSEELRKQVLDSYPGYEITRAVKITEAGREIWVVTVEDAHTFILIRLEDEELEEVQRLQKTS